jgi:hypothetical protein
MKINKKYKNNILRNTTYLSYYKRMNNEGLLKNYILNLLSSFRFDEDSYYQEQTNIEIFHVFRLNSRFSLCIPFSLDKKYRKEDFEWGRPVSLDVRLKDEYTQVFLNFYSWEISKSVKKLLDDRITSCRDAIIEDLK